MPHSDAVINANRVELKRHTARGPDSLFYEFAKGLQVDMTRYYINIRITNSDKRLVEIIFSDHTGCTQQSPVWCSLKAKLDLI